MKYLGLRKRLISVYPNSESWKNKVYSMSDRQVWAINNSFKKRGIYKKKPKDSNYRQIDIFDLWPDQIKYCN